MVVYTQLIARTGNTTCPYDMLKRYAAMAQEDITSNEFVFRVLVAHKGKPYSLRAGSKLSYSRAREVLLH
jgi:hypothetical protein